MAPAPTTHIFIVLFLHPGLIVGAAAAARGGF